MREPRNRVVQVGRFGDPDGLEVVDAPLPTAGRGEVRVRVLASRVTAFTCAFHASGVCGMTFQVGVSGAAISFCICGLTVSGTGIVLAGTSRGGICAGADSVET